MILTEQKDWVELFEALKEETRKSSEKHVNIYVSATDTDSVCSLRILEVCRCATVTIRTVTLEIDRSTDYSNVILLFFVIVMTTKLFVVDATGKSKSCLKRGTHAHQS